MQSKEVASAAPEQLELSILIPCLNEAETLAEVIDRAQRFLHAYGIVGEVVVADNGSTDGSAAIAIAHGARVILIEEKGYGAALRGGIGAATGTYVALARSLGVRTLILDRDGPLRREMPVALVSTLARQAARTRSAGPFLRFDLY